MLTLEERLAGYQEMVRTYHGTLDLVSDRALGALPELVAQARLYGEAMHEHAPAGSVLDLGSGVGLPGVVIGSMFPTRRVWLVERRRRRATFLKMVVARLGLEETRVIEADVTHVRREDLGLVGRNDPRAGGDASQGQERGTDLSRSSAEAGIRVVTAQAVASFADVYCLTRHLHDASVTMISRKGPDWRAEVSALEAVIGTAPAVVGETLPLGGGTLVGIEVRGGLPCPPSA